MPWPLGLRSMCSELTLASYSMQEVRGDKDPWTRSHSEETAGGLVIGKAPAVRAGLIISPRLSDPQTKATPSMTAVVPGIRMGWGGCCGFGSLAWGQSAHLYPEFPELSWVSLLPLGEKMLRKSSPV